MSDKPFCPHCDTGNLERLTNKPDGKESHSNWYCYECERHFDDPHYRESQDTGFGAGHTGLARKLADADPSDL